MTTSLQQREQASADATVTTRSRLRPGALIRLLRPRQWIKNSFVFAPLIFAGLFMDPAAIVRALLAALLFCVAASAVYILNDIADIELDRAHPGSKRLRPLAAGTVTPLQAWIFFAALVALLVAAALAWPATGLVILLYLGVNVAYSFRLKHVPVVDLFCIASGFVLRILVGALAVGVPLSSWMLITTLCLALFLAALKRRQELATSGASARRVLGSYSVALLDRYAELAGTSALLFYGLFVIEIQPSLALSIPLVLFGLFRYWYIADTIGGGESPTDALWSDAPLALTIITWGILSMIVLARG